MSKETITSIIYRLNQYCEEGTHVNFMFQGGEPLIAGKDFYCEFINSLQNTRLKFKYSFSLQTNGTLIDEEYCRIFSENSFNVGVSLDGPEEIHNQNRNQSYDSVLNGINLLRRYNIDFSVLTVITSKTDAKTLYDFYRANGFLSVQMIYCLDSLSGEKSEYSLTPSSLARFKKRFFNFWYRDYKTDMEYMSVREYDNLFALLTENEFEQCGMNGQCTPQLVIESDGTCYPCDFYCIDEYKCINIKTDSIKAMLASKGMRQFLSYNPPVNSLCSNCEFFDICGGGCKRYRTLINAEKGYCPNRDFLYHFTDNFNTEDI